MKPIYHTIPVGLCAYALMSRKINHLKLYVYFKHIASGHLRYDTSLCKHWASDLDMNERTVRNCMKWMIKKKWITVNSKKESIRIIGFQQLKLKLKIKSDAAVVFEQEDFSEFFSFCCAAVITYYIRLKSFKSRAKQSGSKMVGSRKNCSSAQKGFYTLPVLYLAKCLKVSKSTANNYKIKAVNSKFIEVKRQVTTIKDEEGNKISKNEILTFQSNSENVGIFRLGRKYLKKVEADLIKSELKLKRKRSKY